MKFQSEQLIKKNIKTYIYDSAIGHQLCKQLFLYSHVTSIQAYDYGVQMPVFQNEIARSTLA
jgi:hypothetical protein